MIENQIFDTERRNQVQPFITFFFELRYESYLGNTSVFLIIEYIYF